MRILIVRHAEPDYSIDSLTEKGWREAELLANKLEKQKIEHIYCSPLGRAKDTCFTTAKRMGREKDVQIFDWLREFGCSTILPSGRQYHIPWDMYPREWEDEEKAYGFDWKQIYGGEGIAQKYDDVIQGLDELLKKHGYERDGIAYKAKKANRDTLALFCHFGVECVLLSRLCNISPVSLWHHFVALPSSVTTLYTEEREDGRAIFRIASFGDTGHLFAGDEEPSFMARFCETFDNQEERH